MSAGPRLAGARPLEPLPALDAGRAAEEVPEALFRRHAGIPAGALVDPVIEDGLRRARRRFLETARPWCGVRALGIEAILDGEVALEGGRVLRSPALAGRLRPAGAGAVVVAGLTAGREVSEEIERLSREDRPDEAMLLHAHAVAAVEHLRDAMARRLSDHLGRLASLLVPHLSPGYGGWALGGQADLLGCLEDPGPLRVLPSGCLDPTRSTLAAWGVAPSVRPGTEAGEATAGLGPEPGAALPFSVPRKALEKWARDRLRTEVRTDGRLVATFRFDGTTCSSLGMPLALDYSVELRPDGGGTWVVDRCAARPADGDAGHRSMCAWRDDPESIRVALRREPPFVGLDLERAAAWAPEIRSSGCLCSSADRNHKWKIVLETVRWALAASRRPKEGRDA